MCFVQISATSQICKDAYPSEISHSEVHIWTPKSTLSQTHAWGISMPFGVSIYRTGCSNFIAFVLKIGLEYEKASFNNNYDKHIVVKNRTHLPMPVQRFPQIDSLRVTLDPRRSNSKEKWPLDRFAFHSHPNLTQCLRSFLWHSEVLTEPPCKEKKT